MFGHKAGPSRRYTYGCLPPVEGLARLEEQLRLANVYRNRLVEIERQRRQDMLTALLKRSEFAICHSAVEGLEAKLESTRQSVRGERQRQRQAVDAESVVGSAPADLLAALKNARAVLKIARKIALQDLGVMAGIKRADMDAAEAVRVARKACGLYWGTYLTVEQGMDRARRIPQEPRFQRYDGTGTVAVQFQNGLTPDALFAQDTRMRIQPLPDAYWTGTTSGERRRASRTRVQLRIGSEGRDPVWVTLPLILHRPLPAEGKAKWAHLVRTRVGTKFKYELQITMEFPGEPEPSPHRGAVALDIGWRLTERGLRVAYWVDDQGEYGELVLPANLLERFRKVDDLRAIRDENFNVAQASLSVWLKENAAPDWLAQETATLSQWRAPGRLAALAIRWRDRRFDGDTMAFSELEAWRKQDKHLLEWEANQRDNVLKARREIYRVFAAESARRYGMVALEKFDLRRVARSTNPEDGVETNETARHMRFVAAVSTLRQAIKDAAAKHGVRVDELPAEYTTQECHACGHTQKWDAAAQIMHTCPACGVLWDQDENAARVLLGRATGAVATGD